MPFTAATSKGAGSSSDGLGTTVSNKTVSGHASKPLTTSEIPATVKLPRLPDSESDPRVWELETTTLNYRLARVLRQAPSSTQELKDCNATFLNSQIALAGLFPFALRRSLEIDPSAVRRTLIKTSLLDAVNPLNGLSLSERADALRATFKILISRTEKLDSVIRQALSANNLTEASPTVQSNRAEVTALLATIVTTPKSVNLSG